MLETKSTPRSSGSERKESAGASNEVLSEVGSSEGRTADSTPALMVSERQDGMR